jgi:AcrR family transcriptional regulator
MDTLNQPVEITPPLLNAAEKTTKQRLFETAVDLFSSRGFLGVSIRDISSAVGIKESSFYNHYKSKDELIRTIFEFYKTEFTQIMPPEERLEAILSTTPPDEFLRRGNERFMQRISTPLFKKISRILSSEQYRDTRARELVLQDMIELPLAYAELVFTKMMKMGLIRRFDPKILAAEYQYSVSFIFTTFLMLDAENPDPNSIQKKLADHVSFFWNIIRKEKEEK